RQRLARRGLAPAAGLLVVMAGSSEAVGEPSPELVQLVVRAATAGTSRTVAALARGAFPAVPHIRKAVAAALVLAGLLAGGTAGASRRRDLPENPPKPRVSHAPGSPEQPS